MRSLIVALLLSGSVALKVDTFMRKNSSVEAETRTSIGSGHPREQEMMKELDRIMVANGGMKEGHTGECPQMQQALNGLASSAGVNTICETGFNGGHSSLRWLLYSTAHVYAFDLGEHAYARPASEYLQKEFPNRLTPTWGNSHMTLNHFAHTNPKVKCDLIFVDGDHTYEGALADLGDFKKMATPTTVVAIDDVHCSLPWCAAPTAAWTKMISQGVLKETSRGVEKGVVKTHGSPDARGYGALCQLVLGLWGCHCGCNIKRSYVVWNHCGQKWLLNTSCSQASLASAQAGSRKVKKASQNGADYISVSQLRK